MMKLLACLCSVLLLSATALPVEADITSVSAAINKAGRQRMLSQRMLKAYTMIGINVEKEEAEEQLKSAVILFDSQLHELMPYVTDKKIKRSLDKVKSLWHPFKATLLLPVDKSHAIELQESSDELLRASHKVVLQLEDSSGNAYGRLVNIAGRQRMLSQRIAKFYMMRSWQFENAEILSEIEQAKNEFKGALTELLSAPENSPKLQYELFMAEKEWKLLEHGLARTSNELIPLIVAMTSEQLLTRMNEITFLYEQLSALPR